MPADYPIESETMSGRALGNAEAAIENNLQAVKDYLARNKDKAMELERSFEGQVQDHPIRSILIAAGVGLVIGALISR